MKKFTKFFMFLLVAVLGLFAFACDKDTKKPDDGGETKPEIPAELKTAIDYVDALYRDKAGVTTSDWTVIAKSTGLDVVWTVTVTQGQASDVVLTLNDEGTQYTIDVNEKTEAEIKYTLKATITNADGKSVTKEYTFSVPAFKEFTYAEYMAAAKGDTVTIKGVVTAVIGKANGNSYNCLYLQDADGGYYAYGLKEDPSAAGDNQVKAGMTVRVTGIKDIYSGTIEVKEGAYEILDSTLKTVEAVDYTAAYAAAKSLKDEALVGKQSILVKIDNVTILPEDDDIASGYYKFEVGVLQSYARISSSVCPLSKADQDTFKASHKAGYKATVTGVVCVYDGAFYLTPVDANAFSNLQLPTLSDADAVAAEKALLTAPVATVTEDTVVELPTAGAAYKEQVAITWASDNACAVVAADSKSVAFTLPEEACKVTLTATLTAGEATDTVTFEVAVDAAETTVYKLVKVEDVKAGTYKLGMNQTALENGEILLADGTLNNKGALITTAKASKAADFVLAAVEGKANTYTIKLADKYLVAYRNGTYNNLKLDDAACEWVYDATLKTFVATISYDDNGTTKTAEVYMGSYLNTKTNVAGDTMSLSLTSYISGDNASKIDVSQFPVYLYAVKEAGEGGEEQPEELGDPETSTDVLYVSAACAELEEGAKVKIEDKVLLVGTNAFATIDAALEKVAEGKTIKLVAGEYTGATLSVANITLEGPNAGQSPVVGPRVEEAIFKGDIVVAANGITIKGIELTEKGRIKVDQIDGLTMENIYVYGSLLNKGATADAGGVSTDAAFYITASKNIVLKNSMIANDASVEWDRPMIMYGYDIENLTVTGNSFTGRYVNYNDGIKIDNAGTFGIKGNVTISDNSFKDYQQYVIWFKQFGAGTYVIQNNSFEHIGSTDNHGMLSLIAYKGTAEESVSVAFKYNRINNSKMLMRLDDNSALSTNATIAVNYNVYTENAAPANFLNNKDADVAVNADYNYWDGPVNTGKIQHATSENAYTEASDVPAIGDADVANNTYTITFDLNGGEWFEENTLTYVYGHGASLETPEKAGFEFYAWEDANGQLYTSIPASLHQDLALKAVWKATE